MRPAFRRLRDSRALDEKDFRTLYESYALLRSVDHQLRLIVGRSAFNNLLPASLVS